MAEHGEGEECRRDPKCCDVRERLNEIEQGYLDRAERNAGAIHKFSRKSVRWLVVIAVVTFASGIANLYLIDQNGKRADEAVRLGDQIQHERVDAIRTACREQNAHHETAIARLNEGINDITDPAQRARAKRTKAFTVRLIDALTPKRDCGRLVEQSVPSVSRHE